MATYYWVGGNGTWDNSNKANWAIVSNGAGGNGPPTSSDNVNFDANSGTGTCTTAAGSACATAVLNSSTLGLTLGANHTMSGTFTLTAGTLSLGTNTLSCNIFNSSNSNTRTIAFGTGNITLTGSGTTIWTTGTTTNLSVTGTPVVNCTYSGSVGTRTISISSSTIEAQSISFNFSSGSDIIASVGVTKNLNFTGFTGTLNAATRTIYGNLTLGTGMTTASGASNTTFAGSSGPYTWRSNNVTLNNPVVVNIPSQTLSLFDNANTGSNKLTVTAGTFDLNSKTLTCDNFNSSNSNVRTLAFGTGSITLTGSGVVIWTTSTATNLSVTGTPVVNCTYSGSTGTRSITANNISLGGTESIAISFNITAGSDTIALNTTSPNSYKNIDFTGFSGTLSNGGASTTIYGNLTVSSGMSLSSGANTMSFAGTSGPYTITTNNKTFDFPIEFVGISGTWQFANALTQGSTRTFTVTNGTVKLKAGATTTVGSFLTSGSNQKYLQSTTAGSQATLSQASGTVNASYLTIKDINATGGATWNAYRSLSNIDAGNNTGWDFLSTPVTTTTLAMRLGFGL